MKKLTQLVIENPMDIVLAHKRTIRAGELLKLSLSVQTTFTTAISEVARVVLDKAGVSLFTIYLKKETGSYFLVATFDFKNDTAVYIDENEFSFAKKLVKTFELKQYAGDPQILMSLGLPRLLRIDDQMIETVINHFSAATPDNFYEEIKIQKIRLTRVAEKKDEELIKAREINEKKNEFLAIASHELKTPLTVLKGFTSLALLGSDSENSQMKSYLLKINQQADKIHKLIMQLLDISKIEAGQLDFSWEQVSINDYLLEEIESVRMVLPNKIEMDLADNVVLKIDKLRMEQVLSNLFSNASKYADNETAIYLSSTLMPGNIIQFAVKDQGIGMSEETKSKVFDKFYREEAAAKKYSGLGMGLYITSLIITKHGGKIWIDSTPGKGSTFYFSLPYITANNA